ncbi:hypothetical protein PAP_09840 [Palaeococcus pacificus DY20341]|uniref:Glycosyltransferase n=1 Tax=Palaeococcus pacificus DY20341 TaxID=1343739 RepID=A0A075M0P3_9EURY|nr:glycosyltransferase family 4 protein [Palaeococcus pacificus]AIF70343.1 hypothetical protein PAP_09840 [Palaeococcus pacificus DY20341]
MKILQVGSGIPPDFIGGAEIYMYNLAKEISRSHEVHVVYPTYAKTIKQPQIVSKIYGNLHIHTLQIPQFALFKAIQIKNTYTNKSIEQKFMDFLIHIKPDVIHFHNLWRFRSAKLIDVAHQLNIPAVITLHDYWFLCPFSTMINYKNNICDMPEPDKCYRCWVEKLSANTPVKQLRPFLKFTLKRLNHPQDFKKRNEFLKHMLLTVDKIIAPSRFLRKMLIRYDVPEGKIIYLENGYNLDEFKGFKKRAKDTDKIIFGFVGRVSKEKGLHILVDAFMDIPEDKAELRIYGNYDPNSEYIKELLEKIKSKKNIKLMGRFKDVREPYSEIDVLVFPSIWYENCPLVLAEARATKTPVIASNLGAIPGFVKDGKTGLLFRPRDSKDLYEKIMRIIENPWLIKKFKKNIKPPKSMKEHAKEIESLYISLLAGR